MAQLEELWDIISRVCPPEGCTEDEIRAASRAVEGEAREAGSSIVGDLPIDRERRARAVLAAGVRLRDQRLGKVA